MHIRSTVYNVEGAGRITVAHVATSVDAGVNRNSQTCQAAPKAGESK